jgi:predicted alpha/beta hydrolase
LGRALLMDAALDDVFTDDISFPAVDGYSLTGTLLLPRGAKRHAVLINSATAVPRKVYRGFASYLANLKGIGHFGFFPDHRDTLWRGMAEWIQGE